MGKTARISGVEKNFLGTRVTAQLAKKPSPERRTNLQRNHGGGKTYVWIPFILAGWVTLGSFCVKKIIILAHTLIKSGLLFFLIWKPFRCYLGTHCKEDVHLKLVADLVTCSSIFISHWIKQNLNTCLCTLHKFYSLAKSIPKIILKNPNSWIFPSAYLIT